MASLKEVKTRINSVKSTRKIHFSNEDGGFCQNYTKAQGAIENNAALSEEVEQDSDQLPKR